MKRKLGRSNIEVSAVGMGCWAIGGVWNFAGNPAGWSVVDDGESIRAVQKAIDLGATFFDTAANYGCGHSERILGEAVRGQRDQVVIATKFGHKVDAANKEVTFYGEEEAESDVVSHMRTDLETSLKNLGTEFFRLFQFTQKAFILTGESRPGLLDILRGGGKLASVRTIGHCLPASKIESMSTQEVSGGHYAEVLLLQYLPRRIVSGMNSKASICEEH